jgi:hypothetical protein
MMATFLSPHHFSSAMEARSFRSFSARTAKPAYEYWFQAGVKQKRRVQLERRNTQLKIRTALE